MKFKCVTVSKLNGSAMRSDFRFCKFFIAGIAATLLVSASAYALPFNTDMYNPQPMTGSVMRPKANDSVPMGSLERRIVTKDEAARLENPLKGDKLSILNGRRLFAVNCTPCHGTYENGVQKPSWFAPNIGAPDLSQSSYWDVSGGRTDGSIYGTIHLGGMAIMPAYGWKLSPTEHWDIINYVRTIQDDNKKLVSK